MVMDEKKVALRLYPARRSLISSNCFCASSWCPKAWTTFILPSISSVREVSSPLVSDCFRNMTNVFLAIKLATNRDMGVSTTTTAVMTGWMESMNSSVPAMVRTPVNSWVNPMRRPSENWSMSAIIRLMISPDGCTSI